MRFPELQAAMLDAWPTLELAEPAQTFASWDEAYQWAGPRCGYLAGAHPHDVKLLYRSGAWSLIQDISTCMVSYTELLADLSRRVGRVVAATTQGTVGFAELLVFEAGANLRSITGLDGHTTQTGATIPEEEGIPLAHFYLDELDTIWQRLGLASFLARGPGGRSPCDRSHSRTRERSSPDLANATNAVGVAAVVEAVVRAS